MTARRANLKLLLVATCILTSALWSPVGLPAVAELGVSARWAAQDLVMWNPNLQYAQIVKGKNVGSPFGITYSVSNLGAMIRLAAMGEQLGVNLWDYRTPDGRGIRQAVHFLAPYVDPNKVWHYRQIRKVDCREMLNPLLQEAALHFAPLLKPQAPMPVPSVGQIDPVGKGLVTAPASP